MKILVPLFSVAAGASLLHGDLALSQPDQAGGSASRTYRRSSSKSRGSVPPLLIEFTPTPSERAATMEEDLHVMSRLLDKALDEDLGEESPPVRLNLPLLYTSSGRSVRALYLEGFGALFMIKVNFPVIAPPKVEAKEEEHTPPSEWDLARRELREDDEEDEAYAATLDPAQSEAVDSKVESLKNVLLKSLKHAANISGLKPDEFIAVSVFGSEPVGVQVVRVTASTSPSPGKAVAPPVPSSKKKSKADPSDASVDPPEKATSTLITRVGQPAELSVTDQRTGQVISRTVYRTAKGRPQGTVLTLRAKKGDVDAFAKGKLDLETFQERAVFNSYTGNGYGILSINSWIGSSRRN